MYFRHWTWGYSSQLCEFTNGYLLLVTKPGSICICHWMESKVDDSPNFPPREPTSLSVLLELRTASPQFSPPFFHMKGGKKQEETLVDGSEILRAPVEVGSISHCLQGVNTFQVVGLGISEPSIVVYTDIYSTLFFHISVYLGFGGIHPPSCLELS